MTIHILFYRPMHNLTFAKMQTNSNLTIKKQYYQHPKKRKSQNYTSRRCLWILQGKEIISITRNYGSSLAIESCGQIPYSQTADPCCEISPAKIWHFGQSLKPNWSLPIKSFILFRPLFGWSCICGPFVGTKPLCLHISVSSPWWHGHVIAIHRLFNGTAHQPHNLIELPHFPNENCRKNLEQGGVLVGGTGYFKLSDQEYFHYVASSLEIHIDVFIHPCWKPFWSLPLWLAKPFTYLDTWNISNVTRAIKLYNLQLHSYQFVIQKCLLYHHTIQWHNLQLHTYHFAIHKWRLYLLPFWTP